jgi:hypothetical protein
MQAFVDTLANARRLREAQNQEDFDAAVHGIRKAQILRDMDIQLLVAESNEKLYQRSTAFSLMQLRDTIERNKIEQTANFEMQQSEMRQQISLERLKDAYQDERFMKQLEQDNLRFKSSLQQRREGHEQDVVEMKDNITALGMMLDLEEKKRQADFKRQTEIINSLHTNQLEEEKEKHAYEENILKIKSGMTEGQLAAEQLSELTPEAQAAYFNNRDKEAAALARAEAERDKAEFVDRKSSELNQMMADIPKQALNAVGGAAAHDRQRAEDYKADLHREQDRYDRHQEQVTQYMLGGKNTPSSPSTTQAATQSSTQQSQPVPPLIAAPQPKGRIVKCPSPTCGKENDLDEGPFCQYCGTPLQ